MKLDTQRGRRIFQKLLRVAPDLRDILLHARSSVPGFMDLNLDVLDRTPDYRRIVLSHYWQHPSGDMIPDPDMSIAVFFNWQVAEALTYQEALQYDQSYPDPDDAPDLEVHTRLNVFLEQWLDNLIEQGHVVRINYRISL